MADIQSNIKFNIDTASAMASIKALQTQISAFQTQMSRGSSAQVRDAQNLQRTLLDNVNATGKFAASLTTVRTTTESFTNSLEKNKLSMREYFRYSGGASKSFGRFFKSEFDTIGKVARERVKDLQTQYIQLGRDANGAMQAIKIRPLTLDLDNLQTKTAIAAQKQALLNQLLKQGSTNLLNFGKNTQWAGRQLMVGFTIPLGIMGAAAVKSFMQMEQQAVKFKRVYGDLNTTVQESTAMVGTIKTLASEFTKYGVSFKDTMSLAADAAAMGKTGSDLLQQVTETNRLAVLGNVEQSAALETTTSLMNAFGISAENLGTKINFLNAVENQTVTSIGDLTTAIPKAGPVIKQLGGNVEDLAFFLTAMREGGINASEGANALKSGLAALINPTAKASAFMEQFGINVKGIVEANKGDVKGLVIDFAKALDTLDPLNRARAIEQLFGKFQFSRISTLFQNVIKDGSQASKVLELTSASATQLGMLAGQELKKLSDSPMYKFQKAVADIQAQLAPVGEEFLKAVTPIVEFGTKVLEWFNGLESGTKQFMINFVGIVGGIGPILLMTFGLIANGAANIIKLFALMKNGFNKLGGSSKDLASQTQYMTSEQVQASSVAASLDQAHNKLRQTFTLEAGALNELTLAYQRNITASGMRPVVPMRGKKFASGGMISGPGSGTSDSIPAMVSNGEYITNAKQTKKYLPLLQAISQNKVSGYASKSGGSLVGGPDVSSFTNAVGLFTKQENYDLKANKANAGSLGKSILASGGKSLSPILHEAITQMLIESGQKVSQAKIQKEITKNPELVSFIEKTSKTLGTSIANIPGKIGDQIVGAEFKKAISANAHMLTPEQLSAVQRVQSQITTVEDPTKLRIRESGKVSSIGRIGIFKGLTSYKNKKKGYLQTAQSLSGTLPPEESLALAHLTNNKKTSMSEIAKSENLTGSARAMIERGQQGLTQITKEGVLGKSVTVQTEQIKASGISFAEKVKKIWNDSIINGFDQATKRNSPPKEALDAGRDYGNALNSGAKESVDDAKITGQRLGNAVVGGASGTARRAQVSQGSFVPSGTQSGGRRRAKRPGDLEARQAAQAAAMALSGNALSGKSSKELKAARMKVTYNNVKSGKTQIGGKITGAGFGVGAIAGTAAMFAPPEMQGILGTVSMASSLIGMFGGALGKIVPMLMGPVGWAIGGLIVGITALAWVMGEIDKAAKERIANEQALNNAVKMSAEGIKGAASFFGVTAKERIGSNAGVTTNAGITGSRASVSQQLLKDTEFKKENATQIDALRRLNKEDAQRALAGMAADFSSLGFGEDAVQAMVDAMVIAAGRKDVSLKFKSINVATEKGRAGQAKEFGKMLDQKTAQANTSATEVVYSGGYEGIAKTMQRTGTEMRALYDAGKLASNQFSALQEAFNDGTIDLKTYNAQFAKLNKLIKDKAVNPADRFTIMQAAIKSINPEMAKFTKHIKNADIQAKILQATMLGAIIPASILASLGRDPKDARSIAEGVAITTANADLDKIIANATKAAKAIADALNGGGNTTGAPEDKKITAWQKSIDKLKLGLDLISIYEDKINKKYDERIKTLEKVKQIQAEISSQQKDQLDLADALSRGDLAAAAQAAQQMRANNAQRAVDSQTTAIENARTLELSKITNSSGQTRAQLEARISKLELFILKRKGAAVGGHITGPGSGTSDSIPAMLSNGEYVIRANAVKAIGVNTLDKLNHADKAKFADGGLAGFRQSEHKVPGKKSEHKVPGKKRFGLDDIAAGLTNPIIQGGANGTDVMGGFSTAQSYMNVASGKGGFFDYLTAILTPLALTGFGGASKAGMFGKLASKLPGGIKATALNQTARHRSIFPISEVYHPLDVATENAKTFGPGTYFGKNSKVSNTIFRDFGDQSHKITTTPKAAIKTLFSKGYANIEQLTKEWTKNSGRTSYIQNWDKLSKEHQQKFVMDQLDGMTWDDPFIQNLIAKDYTGFKNGDALSNWMVGVPGSGYGLKHLSTKLPFGYAKGGMVRGYSEGGSPDAIDRIGISSTPFQKSNIGRMSPTPLLPGSNSGLPSYGWSGSNMHTRIGKASGGLIKPAYMSGGGSAIDFKPKGMDKIPAMLGKDEYVMRGSAVRKYGTGMMDAINGNRFQMKPPNFKEPLNPSAKVPQSSITSIVNNNINNSSPVYNINVSTGSNASPSEIANLVTEKIKSVDSQKLKESRF
jgi:TP901 family phage tail tape measure protein